MRIIQGGNLAMKCRHCLVEFHDEWKQYGVGEDPDGGMGVLFSQCPACQRYNVLLGRGEWLYSHGIVQSKGMKKTFVHPRGVSREPLHPSIPTDFSADYIEACNVLDISPKASAALSRRCLQHILRDCAKVTAPNLDQEIQQVIKASMVPSYIADSLDAVRNIGNFAAHPMKSTASGEILDVEPGEAEWNLDTVEQLFDFYFVGPAKKAAQKTALNKKLAEAGKPSLK
jgi:hypothetical protein